MNIVDRSLAFWFDELEPRQWFEASDALDAMIRERFESDWEIAADHGCPWAITSCEAALAAMLLLDQFPRNMFRGTAHAFSTDRLARSTAVTVMGDNLDLEIDDPSWRIFFYLPFMHSESLLDQDCCLGLITNRMGAAGADNLRHARAHRAVVEQFGRFPFRNAVLERPTTAAEQEWLAAGGYAAELRKLND